MLSGSLAILFRGRQTCPQNQKPASLLGTAGDLRAIFDKKRQAASVCYDYANQNCFRQIHHRRGHYANARIWSMDLFAVGFFPFGRFPGTAPPQVLVHARNSSRGISAGMPPKENS
jgi:hypothetical protein